jgi:hypothetical protein
MNRRKMLLASTCTVLALVLALPAAAAPLEVIAVKARVESQNGATRGDFEIGGGVPAQIGERLKVSLVGTGIFNGAGREVPIEARFTVAAGGHNLSLVRTGPNWALVSINGAGGNGLAQLAYIAGTGYRMRPSLASGRITFKIGGAGTAAAVPEELPQGYEHGRWRRALEVNAMLYRAILGEEPHGERARVNVDRIYREGYGGVLTTATELARVAEERGLGRAVVDRGYQERDVERVGRLYRDLLHRQQSDQDLWQQDNGFRGQVRALHERGLVAVVESVVGSDEFRSINQIGPR